MPVEGRSLSSRQTQDVVRDPEIGQPINSRQCPEAAEGVARESEGRTWLSLLRAVRQDPPRGRPGPRLCPVPLQQGRTGRGRTGLRGYRGVRRDALARGTGACAQAGDVPSGPYPTRVHPEGQRQAQATGYLDRAGSGLHDGSDAGAGADLRGGSSTGAVRLPPRAQCPAGGGRGGGAAVPWSPGRGGCRSRGLLRKHSAYRAHEVGGAPDRRSARAASDQDVAGLPRGRNRPTRTEDTHDRGPGPRARNPARVSDLTTAGEPLHAPVRVGMEETWAGAKPRLAHRDLRGRPRDPLQAGQGRRGVATAAGAHGQAEADGQRGEDTHL